ncbi:unnamed protein product [Heligmosomoides polygyrus]|uniref:Uncharacterized protein n=1 Tax=Heligmosomoides polygyrus TaxID=6339 RepID=A0A3P8C0M9_HELPZ|nr:unnamed protein product [Heligmosomoides polygyrus]
MKCPLASSPTAAELLEATKKFYVKTDVLRQRKIEPGQPRLFQSTDDDDQIACPKLPSPSAVVPHIPSKRSAFRAVREPPTVHQRREPIQPRSTSFPVATVSPQPPVFPRSSSLAQKAAASPLQPSMDAKPVPKPRLSIMRSMVDLSLTEPEQPRPKPRRKVLLSDPTTRPMADVPHPTTVEAMQNSSATYKKRIIAKSSPNISAPSVAALKRRVHASRPATPVVHNEDPSVMFPVMDESERDFLRAAVRLTYSTDDEDSAPSTPSGGHFSVEKSCFLPSPTIDSGRPNSDDEDRRTQPCSTKSLDDGFFDSSLLRKEEETSSEALTSISNLHKETSEYVPEEGPYY